MAKGLPLVATKLDFLPGVRQASNDTLVRDIDFLFQDVQPGCSVCSSNPAHPTGLSCYYLYTEIQS